MSARPSRSASRFTSSLPGRDHQRDAVGDVAVLERGGRQTQVADPAVRARPDEHDIDLLAEDRLAGLQVHVLERVLEGAPRGRVGLVGRGRDARGDRDAHAGVRAVGDHRLERVGVDGDRLVEGRAVVGRAAVASARPPRPSRRPAARAAGRGRTRTSCRPGRSGRPARRPRCSCCRSSCAVPWSAPRMASPRYSKTWPVPPPTPIRAISARMMSLRGHARREPAVDADLVGLRVALQQRLGREDHLDLARPDPERQRPERAVGAGVRVAADDGHARLGQAQLRSDDVDDALRWRADAVERDAELGAVASRAGRSGPRPAGRASAGCAASSGSSDRRWPRSATAGGRAGRAGGAR